MRFSFILCLIVCWLPQLRGQFTYDHLEVDQVSAVTYKNLRLIPIRAQASFLSLTQSGNMAAQSYLTLREAMAQNLLLIEDRAGVRRLLISNRSDRPVLILSGEVIKGGKQDRIMARDAVLPPNSVQNRVDVYCVEKKRWSSPKEWTYYHEGSMHLRRVVDESQNQREVWREVDYELKQDNVRSRTRAYTEHGNNPRYRALEQEYLDAFSIDAFPNPGNIIGIVGVTGNVVIGCDMFASPELFAAEYTGLIFSYLDEAITFGLPVSIQATALNRYLDNLLANERVQRAFIQQYGKVFTQNGQIVHITTFDER